MKQDRIYLQHILDAITRIEQYTASGKEAFSAQTLIQDGVIRNLEVIGEAVRNVAPEFQEKYPGIPWRAIAGLRNVLVHEYFRVDLDIVWNVIESRIPVLKAAMLAGLSTTGEPESS